MNLMGVLPIALWIGFAIFSIIFILPYTTALLEKLSLSQLQRAKSLMSQLKDVKVDGVPTSNLSENKSECEQETYLVELKSNLPTELKEKVSEMAKSNRIYVKQKEDNKYVIDLSSRNKWKINDTPLCVLGLSICLSVALIAFHITSFVYIINYAKGCIAISQKSVTWAHHFCCFFIHYNTYYLYFSSRLIYLQIV